MDSRTDLQVLDRGSLTAVRYRDKSSSQLCDLSHVGPDFILMQDNGRAHTPRVVMAYLDQEEINVTDWPARSSDLDPSEHLWTCFNDAFHIGRTHLKPYRR